MYKVTQICRSGNSYYVTLPRPMMRELGLRPKDPVILKLAEGAITLAKFDPEQLFDRKRAAREARDLAAERGAPPKS